MSEQKFKFDVFLSYSQADKSIMHSVAIRLYNAGLRVFSARADVATVKEALECSRVMILFLSRNAFGTEWSTLESYTFPFRDPSNQERRFIPVRLDDSPVKEGLKEFALVDFRQRNEAEYHKLIAACQPPPPLPAKVDASDILKYKMEMKNVSVFAMSVDGSRAIAGFSDGRVELLDVSTGELLRTFREHETTVSTLCFSNDGLLIASTSDDGTFCAWDLRSYKRVARWEKFQGQLQWVGRTCCGLCAVSTFHTGTILLSNVRTGHAVRNFDCQSFVFSAAVSPDERFLVAAAENATIRIWDLRSKGRPPRILDAHTDSVMGIAISSNGHRAVSCSADSTIKLWDLRHDADEATLEGHTSKVREIAMTPDGRWAVSTSDDQTLRVWNLERGTCVLVVRGLSQRIVGLYMSQNRQRIALVNTMGDVQVYDIPANLEVLVGALDTTRYTNAKVLLAGESGVGKTGLAYRLTENSFMPTISTDGAWATQLKLPYVQQRIDIEREIWLWDFAGQADYRLIHQLYMDETALAVLVFNPQSQDPFDGLGQWDKDLQRASRRAFNRILVAARCDRGGLMVSRDSVERFKIERGFKEYIETSAATGAGCDELLESIVDNIPWRTIPWKASPKIFRSLKEEIVRLKDKGKVLLRSGELKQQLEIALPGQRFSLEELLAVVGLLAGPGIIWQLEFGDFLLLQPELINSYAAAVIRSVRAHTEEIGCIAEQDVLAGDIDYQTMRRLPRSEEQIVLRAMHQTLVDHGLCLREHTERGTLLIFPSYFKRERPELAGHPSVLVTYQFSGPLDEIYATLVVRLYHTKPFHKECLWRFAADFKTDSGKRLGFKMIRGGEGKGEMQVYFEPGVPDDTQVTFIRYVHEHLVSKAQEVRRIRHYVCPHCHTPVESQKAIERRVSEGKTDVLCPACEKRVILFDIIEEKFASNVFAERARALAEQAKAAIDNESKELILVGHTFSIAGEAGQIYRQFTNSDHGIDGEIEFKDYKGDASGRRVYLQLKSGDSYLYQRQSDGAEIFRIKNERHAAYWQQQAYPVMLVIRTSDGAIRWMDVSDYLKRESAAGKQLKQIVFGGEPLTALNLRRLRDRFVAPPRPDPPVNRS